MAWSVGNDGGTGPIEWMGRGRASIGRAPQMSQTPLRTLPALRQDVQSATSTATRRRPRAAALWSSIVTSCMTARGFLETATRTPRGLSVPELCPFYPYQATTTSSPRDDGHLL
jgi:hypothetical protein